MSQSDSKLDPLKKMFSFENTRSHMGPNLVGTMDVKILVFEFRPQISLLKMLCGKAHCYDATSTCPAKDLVCSNECTQNVKVYY
jgi:hypothetical protein